MCGEEKPVVSPPYATTEIPPRVRRRARMLLGRRFDLGNTSACAEKSMGARAKRRRRRKYLRVCGEEPPSRAVYGVSLEIPPRVRRREIWQGQRVPKHGNTSACAEKRVSCTWHAHKDAGNTSACAEKRLKGVQHMR